MKTQSQKFLQKRRFCMALPVLVLPFITLIFWALGGGQGTPAQASQIRPGLNLSLPGAHFNKEEELWDKFTLYEQAKRDSQQYEEARKNDPYYVVATLKASLPDTVPKGNRLNTSLGTKDKYRQISDHEALINKKLELLTQQISQPQNDATLGKVPERDDAQAVHPSASPSSAEIDRLEQMMESMSSEGQRDPEMEQIDGMLDKILDIQYPGRVQKNESIEAASTQSSFSVEAARQEDNISLVEPPDIQSEPLPEGNGFYGLDEESFSIQQTGNAIRAVVHDSQEVVAGSTVKLRLLSDVYINGRLIGKNQFVFGTCMVSGERLMIEVASIRDEYSLYPVSLKVFDLDGIEGVHIPGAITRDAAKQASGQSLQGMPLLSMNTSLGAQAAAAGIEATKGLLGKKAKLIKITLKSGYQVLLKDKNQKLQ
ncbi:MAG TPA: conjugative transposon protein TraM [Chryseolinea sp.]